MLNAFRHHRGRHIPPRRRTRLIGHVLNAFRHHRGRHVGEPQESRPRPEVLNAFRHHRGRHWRHTRLAVFSADRVLNAFRHHRGRHPPVSWTFTHDDEWCSTPFGITEVGTKVLRGRGSGYRRAQRLSASQRSALAKVGVEPMASAVLNAFRHHRGRHLTRTSATSQNYAKCSTPFGITEVGTDSAQVNFPRNSTVLNAFRHHRGRHRFCSPVRREPGRVLNAFRHHRGRHSRIREQSGQFATVLNAFRHHRGRHSSCIGSSRDQWHRAQRLSASQRSARLEAGPGPCPGLNVLNAFRHHRGRHRSRKTGTNFSRGCSTPFGITEVGTMG